MFSKSLFSDFPEWLFVAIIVFFIGTTLALGIWAIVLETSFTGPYTLIKKSNEQKWRRAALLALLQTGLLPILGLFAGLLSLSLDSQTDNWLFIPFCGAVWVVVFPLVTLFKRWEFDRHIKRYQKIDKSIKGNNEVYRRFTRWTGIFMTAELRRFFNEGYSEPESDKEDVVVN